MNKLALISLVVLAFAGVAAAQAPGWGNHGHQCSPEPITMLGLIPGALMLIRRRSNKA
jgi:hypothetical protein